MAGDAHDAVRAHHPPGLGIAKFLFVLFLVLFVAFLVLGATVFKKVTGGGAP